jgi:hypothetical protein
MAESEALPVSGVSLRPSRELGCVQGRDTGCTSRKEGGVISEADLARDVCLWLRDEGWEIFHEVALDWKLRGKHAIGDARADIVAKRDGELAVVEVKRDLSFELMAQGERWLPFANMVWIAVPRAQRSAGRDLAFRVVGKLRLGLIEIDDTRIIARVGPHVRDHLESDALIDSLRPEHKTAAASGTSGGGQWSSFKETCAALKSFVEKHPGSKIEEAVGQIRHHYSSNASASASLRKAIRNEQVPGVFPGWKKGLYPTPQTPGRGLGA